MNKKDQDAFLRERQSVIIEAAKHCFSKDGFHGSMANLVAQSGFGAGQIYRYFSSKEALITAVIQSVLGEWRMSLSERLTAKTKLCEIFDKTSAFWSGWETREQLLLLEIYSEASRNDSVRNILFQEEENLLSYLESRHDAWPVTAGETPVRLRIKLMLLIIDGFICRVVSADEPDLDELSRIDNIIAQ